MNLLDAVELSLDAFVDIEKSESQIYSKGRSQPMIRYLSAALAEDAMQRFTNEQQMIERGTKAWAGVPDATAWVQEMRGNVPAPTSLDSRQVDPVAYVTGYSKGRCIIEAVDPDWLLPVGMALYRSPTINKTETVEPVAYMMVNKTHGHTPSLHFTPPEDWHATWEAVPLYPVPPKRKPLTEEHLTALCRQHWDRQANVLEHVAYARAIERAHDIGGEK